MSNRYSKDCNGNGEGMLDIKKKSILAKGIYFVRFGDY
jgi:hypothetical protein